jgi:hypothetical protein
MKFDIKNKNEQRFQPSTAQQRGGAAIDDNRKTLPVLNAGPVVQRRIIDIGHAFAHNDRRPTWRRTLKDWTAFVYNLHHQYGIGHPQAIRASTNLGRRGLARTHKIPFQKLQLIIEDFCNGQQSYANLTTFCNLVIKTTSPAHGTKMNLLANLHAAVTANPMNRAAVVRAGNDLLAELNNSTDNVLIGDSSTNSGIRERGDWNFAVDAFGRGTMTPISGEAYQTLNAAPFAARYNPGLYVRPAALGGTVVSSHIMSAEPSTILPHYPAQPVFTTKYWRYAGLYVNGVVGTSGQLRPPGHYPNQPI